MEATSAVFFGRTTSKMGVDVAILSVPTHNKIESKFLEHGRDGWVAVQIYLLRVEQPYSRGDSGRCARRIIPAGANVKIVEVGADVAIATIDTSVGLNSSNPDAFGGNLTSGEGGTARRAGGGVGERVIVVGTEDTRVGGGRLDVSEEHIANEGARSKGVGVNKERFVWEVLHGDITRLVVIVAKKVWVIVG